MNLLKKLLAGSLAISVAAGAFGGLTAVNAANENVEIIDIDLSEEEINRIHELSQYTTINANPLYDSLNVINADPTLPEKFDLRDVNGVNYVTPVKNQGLIGCCWAFGIAAAAETSILYEMKNSDNKEIDASKLNLSELQIAWFGSHPLPETGNVPYNQYGEGRYAINGLNSGGPFSFCTNIMAMGIGPSSEELAPYRNHSGKIYCYNFSDGNHVVVNSIDEVPEGYTAYAYNYSSDEDDDWSVDEKYRSYSNILLEDAYILPCSNIKTNEKWEGYNEDGITAVKEALYAGRGVAANYYMDQENFLSKNFAHYCYADNIIINHIVCIVGWDDTYSRDNFNQGTTDDGVSKTPPADGAWIVKNSWGSSNSEFPFDWGIDGSGYFYLSYYDKSILAFEAYDFDTTTYGEDRENNILQYDYAPYSWLRLLQDPNDMKYANVFTAKKNYLVNSVGVTTETPGTKVSYKIYKLNRDYRSPDDGELIAEGTDTFKYGGYHKIDLDKPIELNTNETVSVVAKQTVGDTDVVPMNCGFTEYYLSLPK